MDVSVALDSDGTLTVAAVNIHPIDYDATARLIADIVTRVHRELSHCEES